MNDTFTHSGAMRLASKIHDYWGSRGADTTAPFSGECLTLLCMSAKAVGLTDVSSRVTGCVVSAAQPLFWGYK